MTLRRNAVANYLGQGWAAVMGLAFIPLYIRYMGVEAYGLIGVFAVLQTWLALLDLGLAPSLAREMARSTTGRYDAQSIRDLLRSVEVAAGVIALAAGLLLWAASPWIASHWLRPDALPLDAVTRALALAGVVIALRFVENVYRSSLIGLQRQVLLNVVTAAAATLRGAGAVLVLAWFSPTIDAFFVWQGLVSAATIIVLAVVLHRALPPGERHARASLDKLRGIRQFATGTLLLTGLGFLLSQSDKFVLSRLLSLSDFGLYSIAHSIASAVRMLAQPIDQAVYPRLTQLHEVGDASGLARLYHASAQYSAVLMGGTGVFLAVFGQSVLALWMQDSQLAARTYSVFWILVAGMVLNGFMNAPYYLQLAAGWTALLTRVNAILVVTFVPIIYVLTLRYSMIGAAIAWLVLNAVYVVTIARLMHRRLLTGEMRAWYLEDLAAPMGAAIATAAALWYGLPRVTAVVPTVLVLVFALTCILVAAALAARTVRVQLGAQWKLIAGGRA